MKLGVVFNLAGFYSVFYQDTKAAPLTSLTTTSLHTRAIRRLGSLFFLVTSPPRLSSLSGFFIPGDLMSKELTAALSALTEQLSRQSDAIESMVDINQHLLSLLIDTQLDDQSEEPADHQDLDG